MAQVHAEKWRQLEADRAQTARAGDSAHSGLDLDNVASLLCRKGSANLQEGKRPRLHALHPAGARCTRSNSGSLLNIPARLSGTMSCSENVEFLLSHSHSNAAFVSRVVQEFPSKRDRVRNSALLHGDITCPCIRENYHNDGRQVSQGVRPERRRCWSSKGKVALSS